MQPNVIALHQAAEKKENLYNIIKMIHFKKLIITAIAVAAFAGAGAQNYVSPLDVATLQTSSNFGKLRSTRFHSGVDFRTEMVEGKKVFAVQKGYISRIGVKPYGYGNVVYVTHPDGRVSVYGHLSRFTPAVEKYVRAERYRLKKNTIDLFPSAGKFPVEQGELIGWSGNTGNSFGPHLHFEIREPNGRTVNTIARGYYTVKDNLPPEIFKVYYYVVDTLQGVPVHRRVAQAATVKRDNTHYTLASDMVLPGKGYFSVETMDRKNDVSGSMTTYRIVLKVDDIPVCEYVMDGFLFDQNHCAKIVSDYRLNSTTSNDVFRLALLNRCAANFYPHTVNNGLIDPVSAANITIEVEDDSHNVSVLSFPVKYDPSGLKTLEVPDDTTPVDYRKNTSLSVGNLKVTIPADALYESMFYHHSRDPKSTSYKPMRGMVILSDFYSLHDASVPLRSPIVLSFAADVPEELRSKVILVRATDNGKYSAVSASYSNGAVTGKASSFGTWCAAADTENPRIEPLFTSGDNLSNASRIGFRISDNLAGVASYTVEVDGKWVLVEHDTVKSILYHYFDDELCGRSKTHSVKVTVTDGANNKTTYTGTYYR